MTGSIYFHQIYFACLVKPFRNPTEIRIKKKKRVRGKREVPGHSGGSLTSGLTPWTHSLWLHLLLAEEVELGSWFPDFTTFPNDKVHLWSLCFPKGYILRLSSILLNPDVKWSLEVKCDRMSRWFSSPQSLEIDDLTSPALRSQAVCDPSNLPFIVVAFTKAVEFRVEMVESRRDDSCKMKITGDLWCVNWIKKFLIRKE